jgi:hypothetical protein
MGELAELYGRMKVTVRSVDRSVTLHVVGKEQITVELAPGIARMHTEASLARQLELVARVAITAVQRGTRQANRRVLGIDEDQS